MISEKLFYLPAVMAEYHEARRKGASVAEEKRWHARVVRVYLKRTSML